jgi:hypothetical protein
MPNPMPSLYTIIAEYRGGTYCSQVTAADDVQALKHWADHCADDPELLAAFGPQGIRTLQQADWAEADRPTPLRGLVNVWCASISFRQSLCLINVVRTAA